jgi:choice-of-anchor C domain-containing protein
VKKANFMACVACLVWLATSAAWAGIIFQDGFDHAGTVPYMATLYASQTFSVPPWTVTSGSIDWIGTCWVPADGNGSVDMSALVAGQIKATLPTISGHLYSLSFYLAGNPDGGAKTKVLQAQVGNLNQTFSFDITGKSVSQMGWVLETADFTATGNDTLAFTSWESDPFGPALDLVTVRTVNTGVPEPGSALLAGLSFATLLLIRRRQQK